MAVPWTCWYTCQLYTRQVDSRHRLRREQISSTLRVVLCRNEGPFSSLSCNTLTAKEVGTRVVYTIPCYQCPRCYVGQTGQSLEQCLGEHRTALRKRDVLTWRLLNTCLHRASHPDPVSLGVLAHPTQAGPSQEIREGHAR